MKTWKEYVSLCLALLMLALCVAGCHSQTPDPTEGPTAGTTESSASTETTGNTTASSEATNATELTSATNPSQGTEPTTAPTQKPTAPPATKPTTPPATQKPTNPPATQPATTPPTQKPTAPPATQPPAALGSQANPAALVIGSNTAKSTGSDGYYFTWTATADATLTLLFPEENWSYVIENLTAGQAMTQQSSSTDEMVYNPAQVSVLKGDQIRICVKSTANVAITADAAAVLGTQENPYHVTVGTPFSVRIPGGGKVYLSGRAYGAVMTVKNAGSAKLSVNGTDYTPKNGAISVDLPYPDKAGGAASPMQFVLTNTSGSVNIFEVDFSVPMGDSQNPAALAMGSNTASVKENDQDGYIYSWTAPADGTLTLTMPKNVGWWYVVHNMTTYQYGDICFSDDSPVKNPVSITVKQGDVLQISVSTYDPKKPSSAPAGEVTFTAAFQ